MREAVFILISATIVAVLLSLTIEIGRQSAFNSLPLRLIRDRWPGFALVGVLFLFLCCTGRMYLRCRNLQMECRAVRMECERTKQEIDRIYSAAISTLAATLEAHDREILGKHLGRVAGYALALARELGLSPEETAEIYYASMLHDIGKIGIPEAILNKPAPLTGEEREEIRRHPEIGARIVEKLLEKEGILSSILHHHEFYDGTGYPSGLARQEIPLGARIISIADAYDAMTSNRPYRPAFTHEQAIVELIRNAGKQFDPYLLMRFLEVLERGEIKQSGKFSPSFEFFSPDECRLRLH